jgi:hypothetical protein
VMAEAWDNFPILTLVVFGGQERHKSVGW